MQQRCHDYQMYYVVSLPMNLILIKQHELSANANGKTAVFLDAKDARTKHILNHLRKSPGEQVSVGIIGGPKGKAVVELLNHDEGGGGGHDLRLILQEHTETPPAPEITLLLAVPFPKRLKALWSMIASFGVTRIVIVRGQLSDADHCKTSASKKPEVYETLIEEGMSQGGHTRKVTVDIDVEDVISKATLAKLGIVGETNQEGRNNCGIAKLFLDCGDEEMVPSPAREIIMKNCLQKESSDAMQNESVPSAIVAVGPERGWTEAEARLFIECGFESASLGSSILRVDTAVIAGLGIVSAALDECDSKTQDINSNKRTKT